MRLAKSSFFQYVFVVYSFGAEPPLLTAFFAIQVLHADHRRSFCCWKIGGSMAILCLVRLGNHDAEVSLGV